MRFAAFFVDQTWQGQHKMEKTQHARTEAALEAFLESPEFENRPVLAIGGEHRKRTTKHAKALACVPKSRRAWVVGGGVRFEYSPTGRQTTRRKSVKVGSFPAFPDAIGAASMAST